MTTYLFIQAMVKFFSGVFLTGLFIFIPAGTLHYAQGLIFMGALFTLMFIAGIGMMFYNPTLLQKRLHARESESEQRIVIALSSTLFLGGFILAGLSYRLDWGLLSIKVSCAALIPFFMGYIMYAFVLIQNEYLSRTIEIQSNQRVIDTGLYGIVRHPMYSATLLLFLSMPLVLGSLPSFILFLLYPAIIVRRLKNEEEILAKGLPGYADYITRVKYRLIPFIW